MGGILPRLHPRGEPRLPQRLQTGMEMACAVQMVCNPCATQAVHVKDRQSMLPTPMHMPRCCR